MMSEPRDVIARAVEGIHVVEMHGMSIGMDTFRMSTKSTGYLTDHILAALDAAGFVIVPKKVARAGELILDVVPGFKRMTDPEPGKD
jgi:hypothetical protein